MKTEMIFNCQYMNYIEASVLNIGGFKTPHQGWLIVACLKVEGQSYEEWPLIETFSAKKPNKNTLRKLKSSAKKELTRLYDSYKIEKWLQSEVDELFGGK